MITNNIQEVITCSQNDTALRKWNFQLYNGDDIYIPNGNASMVCSNQVEVPMSIEGDTLYCDCTSELSAESGRFRCKIKIEEGNEVLYTALFILKVEVKP